MGAGWDTGRSGSSDVKSFGHRWRFSNARLRALGWTPRVGTTDGMAQAFAWFASRAAPPAA